MGDKLTPAADAARFEYNGSKGDTTPVDEGKQPRSTSGTEDYGSTERKGGAIHEDETKPSL